MSGPSRLRVQQRLIAEEGCSFGKAKKIAQAMELAAYDARALQQAGAHNGALVHKLSQQPRLSNQAKEGSTCYQCNGVTTLHSAVSATLSAMPEVQRAT